MSQPVLTRCVYGTLTSEVTPVTVRYIHPPHHGYPKRLVMVMNDHLTSLSFHVNQPSHSWNKDISKFDLETWRSRSWVWFMGLRPVLEFFLSHCMRGHAKQELKYCSHKPKCIVTTNPNRLVLITIITWRCQFHRVNASILHLKYEYGARSKRRLTCYSHCWPFTTGIVASQYPARDAALIMHYLTRLISACLKVLKRNMPQNMFAINLQT